VRVPSLGIELVGMSLGLELFIVARHVAQRCAWHGGVGDSLRIKLGASLDMELGFALRIELVIHSASNLVKRCH
jgi:hypothetical protein